MKYRLINTQTKEEHLCDKVTIDGFDYYVSDESSNGDYLLRKEFYINLEENKLCQQNDSEFMKWMGHTLKRPMATNNPNIDISKVVNDIADGKEIKELAKSSFFEENSIESFNSLNGKKHFFGFAKGYNKSQETHPFSEEDMIEFYKWLNKNGWEDYDDIKKGLFVNSYGVQKQDKELLQLWKEQQPKIVYYNG